MGYLVIEDAIPLSIVEAARARFTALMEDKIERFRIPAASAREHRPGPPEVIPRVMRDFRPEGGNHDFNRWNMHLPSEPVFFNDLIMANSQVMPHLESQLGSELVAFLAASDTPYPGASDQSIHQDFERPGFTVNIPLVDFGPDNAPLELWPGTHREVHGGPQRPFGRGRVRHDRATLRYIAAHMPSRRLRLRRGAILIRDQRLVHRGTANLTAQPRPCLSIWYKDPATSPLLPLIRLNPPSRATADRAARHALALRRRGRGGAIANRRLLNWGNLYGRIVEELSCSDRDHRRPLSDSLWRQLSPALRHLLRFATVGESPETRPPSAWPAELGFRCVSTVFSTVGEILRVAPPGPAAG